MEQKKLKKIFTGRVGILGDVTDIGGSIQSDLGLRLFFFGKESIPANARELEGQLVYASGLEHSKPIGGPDADDEKKKKEAKPLGGQLVGNVNKVRPLDTPKKEDEATDEDL